MKPFCVFLIASYLTLIEANYIRINNTGTENVVLIIEAVAHPPRNGTLIEPRDYLEIAVLNEWEGSFYVYPEECLTESCDYPVTKIRVAFERPILGGFYDFLDVDLSEGFSVPASIRSITRSECEVRSCSVNLLEFCPERDQIKNQNNKIVSCKTSELNYKAFKEKCPQAMVDGDDLNLGICFSMDYELTFG